MQLNDPDKAYLISFVEEVLAAIHNDDVGVTYGLEDMALNAGVILGLSKEYMESIE
jgi:hypothetical protein